MAAQPCACTVHVKTAKVHFTINNHLKSYMLPKYTSTREEHKNIVFIILSKGEVIRCFKPDMKCGTFEENG